MRTLAFSVCLLGVGGCITFSQVLPLDQDGGDVNITVVCRTSDDCGAGSACDDFGRCVRLLLIGEACSVGTTCKSGNCDSGMCCDAGADCCRTSLECNAPYACDVSILQCRTACENDQQCRSDAWCHDGICESGVRPQAFGQMCTEAVQCLSGSCESGMCCDAGIDCCRNDDECGAPFRCDVLSAKCLTTCDDGADCKSTAWCNAGTCEPGVMPQALGAGCSGAAQCASNICDSGLCCAPGVDCCQQETDCDGAYTCNAATQKCFSDSCADDTKCKSTAFCAAASSTCEPKLGTGADCNRDAACESNRCNASGKCTANGILYVAAGGPAGVGTIAQPFNSISAALTAAAGTFTTPAFDDDKPNIHVAVGDYSESVEMVAGVMLKGGFPTGFGSAAVSPRADGNPQSKVTSAAPFQANVGSTKTVVTGMAFFALESTGNTVAGRVENSAGLELIDNVFSAADGADGAPGAFVNGKGGSSTAAAGSSPIPQSNGASYVAPAGGVAGHSGSFTGYGGGRGGGGLGSGIAGCIGAGSSGSCTRSPAAPKVGMNDPSGSGRHSAVNDDILGGWCQGVNGANGTNATPPASRTTDLLSTGYNATVKLTKDGKTGSVGNLGTPGHGGGGGGTGYENTGNHVWSTGGGGGQGGVPGLQGDGGNPGRGAGSSIALWITGALPKIQANKLETAAGGTGGTGSAGGAGGSGGAGGAGADGLWVAVDQSNNAVIFSTSFTWTRGGAGGSGGSSSRGQHGTGGQGGNSFPVLLDITLAQSVNPGTSVYQAALNTALESDLLVVGTAGAGGLDGGAENQVPSGEALGVKVFVNP